jgi:aryl-alcohol dehydrogenase-like predicted oxidoreductase
MNYSRLGSSDLKVSQIAFGCMSLPPDESESIPLLHKAIDIGINLFDTADIYNDGLNEVIVGKAIKEKRDRVLIASKAGNVRRADGGLDWNPSKKHILGCIDKSLQRLGTDYIDLYQLHGGTIEDNIDETIDAFEKLKKEGKIRYYGISSIRPNVIREYVRRSSIVSVMTQYSLLDRRPEEETLELLHKHDIGVLVRGSVAQGLLIDKPPRQYLDLTPGQVNDVADAVKKTSLGEGRSFTQTAIGYVLANKAVTSVVVGIRTQHQLEEAVSTIDKPDLTPEAIAELRSIVPPLKYSPHR